MIGLGVTSVHHRVVNLSWDVYEIEPTMSLEDQPGYQTVSTLTRSTTEESVRLDSINKTGLRFIGRDTRTNGVSVFMVRNEKDTDSIIKTTEGTILLSSWQREKETEQTTCLVVRNRKDTFRLRPRKRTKQNSVRGCRRYELRDRKRRLDEKLGRNKKERFRFSTFI